MSIESRIISNKPLAPLSTFGIGGPARLFIDVKSAQDMAEVRQYINREKLPFWILGRGSNSLFDDQGFDGLVVLNSIRFCMMEEGNLHVGAGYNFSLLGAQMARQGWSGLEFASGIPGSVGGAVFMNAGASGAEVGDVITRVEFIDQEGKRRELKREELNFSYRHSSFHENLGIIVGARFRLEKCLEARKKQLKIVEYRTATQPYGQPSAGCVFRNPSEEKSAGSLIEACGLKGTKIGGAEVSTLHANFIVNRGGATASDVTELATLIRKTVKEKTGVQLEMEVRRIPYQPERG